MKIRTRMIHHSDGPVEIRRVFDDGDMIFWDAGNPLAFEKSIVWLDNSLDREYVRFAMIRNARSRRGTLVVEDGIRRIVGYAKLTPDAPFDRGDKGYARRVFYVLSDELENESRQNGFVHPVSRCVDPRTVLPTVMGKMPHCNKRLKLNRSHLNSAEVRPTALVERVR